MGEGLIVLTALLERCTKRMIIHVCAKMIASGSILCAGELKTVCILSKFYGTGSARLFKSINRRYKLFGDIQKVIKFTLCRSKFFWKKNSGFANDVVFIVATAAPVSNVAHGPLVYAKKRINFNCHSLFTERKSSIFGY